MNLRIDYHAERCFRFINLIHAEIKRLAFCNSIVSGKNGIHYLSGRISQRSIGSVNINRCLDFIFCSCKTLNCVNRLIHTVRLSYRCKNFAGFGNLNNAFLRIVAELYHNNLYAAVLRRVILRNIKLYRFGAENIPIRSRDFHKRISLAKLKLFGCDQHTCIIGVEGVDGSNFGIGESHFHLGTVGAINLEACAGVRNRLAAFRIGLDDLNKGLEICIVDKIAIGFAVLGNKYIKVRHQLAAFPAGDLMNSVNAVRQILALSKAIFIAHKVVSFCFLGNLKVAGRFQIDCKYCAAFRRLNLCIAIVGVLDNSDIAFLNLFGYINGGGRIALNGVVFCFSTNMIRGSVEQIAFRRLNFLDAPIVIADIVCGGELAVLIGNIGVYELIALINTVGRACKRSIALCCAGLIIALRYSHIELFENVGEALIGYAVPLNRCALAIRNHIADCGINFLQGVAGTDQHILKGCYAVAVRNGELVNRQSADGSSV